MFDGPLRRIGTSPDSKVGRGHSADRGEGTRQDGSQNSSASIAGGACKLDERYRGCDRDSDITSDYDAKTRPRSRLVHRVLRNSGSWRRCILLGLIGNVDRTCHVPSSLCSAGLCEPKRDVLRRCPVSSGSAAEIAAHATSGCWMWLCAPEPTSYPWPSNSASRKSLVPRRFCAVAHGRWGAAWALRVHFLSMQLVDLMRPFHAERHGWDRRPPVGQPLH
jgi:hypothetical protein